MEEKSTLTSVIKGLTAECEKLHKENKVLKAKLSVAREALEVLLCDGNMNGIPQKTLEAIKSYNQELPQDTNTEENKKTE